MYSHEKNKTVKIYGDYWCGTIRLITVETQLHLSDHLMRIGPQQVTSEMYVEASEGLIQNAAGGA